MVDQHCSRSSEISEREVKRKVGGQKVCYHSFCRKIMRGIIAILLILVLVLACALPGMAAAPFAEADSSACSADAVATMYGNVPDIAVPEDGTETGRSSDAVPCTWDDIRSAQTVTWFQLVERFPQATVQLQNVVANGMLGASWLLLASQAFANDLALLPFDVNGTFIDLDSTPHATMQLGEHFALTDGSTIQFFVLVDGSYTWNMYCTQVAPYLQAETVEVPSNLLGIVPWSDLIAFCMGRTQGSVYVVFGQDGRRIDAAGSVPVAAGQHYVICSGTGSSAKVLAAATVRAASPVDMPAPGFTWSDMLAQHPGVRVIERPCSTSVWDAELQQYVKRDVTWLQYFLGGYVNGTESIPFAADGSIIPLSEWNTRVIQKGDYVFRTTHRGTPQLIQMTDPAALVPPNYSDYQAAFGFPTLSMAAKVPFSLQNSGIGQILTGASVGNRRQVMTVRSLLDAFNCPRGSSCEVLTPAREVKQGDLPLSTGDILVLTSMAGTQQEFTVVVYGDVLGTGVVSVSQLVRMARALTGDPLHGAYLFAGDMTGNGQLDIADLIREAEILTGS